MFSMEEQYRLEIGRSLEPLLENADPFDGSSRPLSSRCDVMEFSLKRSVLDLS